MTIRSINDILKMISEEDKLNYNRELIEKLYCKYQRTKLCDKNVEELIDNLKGKEILLIGPGLSVLKEKDTIDSFIRDNQVIIISVNCIPDFDLDYLFVGNDKRYSMLSSLCGLSKDVKIIATSNVSSIRDEFNYILNFEKLSNDNELIFDNSFIIALKILKQAQIKKVYLAGFDGFSKDNLNYFDEYMDFKSDFEKLSKINFAIKSEIEKIGQDIVLEFITSSFYSGE